MEGILSSRLQVHGVRSFRLVYGDHYGCEYSSKNQIASAKGLRRDITDMLGTALILRRFLDYHRQSIPTSFPAHSFARADLWRYPLLCHQHV